MSTHFEVIVIGAGISGVGAGVRLREAGIRDFLIIEAADDFGGTWRANTYPGCQCDVPSRLYSYSFAPNPEWTRVYAHQPEILAYVKAVADRHRLPERARFGVRMTEARWQPDAARWRISTDAGEFTARFLIAGAGPWNEPLIPDIPGLAEFPGEVFHSARWNHDYDLRGKRVAVLGTGASAVQFVPAIAPQLDRLHLFQRTAQWVLPKPDHRIPKAERWVMRHVPGARAAVAAVEYRAMEMLGHGFRRPSLLRGVQVVARAHRPGRRRRVAGGRWAAGARARPARPRGRDPPGCSSPRRWSPATRWSSAASRRARRPDTPPSGRRPSP
jgi:cyclohexanone monooxygenase